MIWSVLAPPSGTTGGRSISPTPVPLPAAQLRLWFLHELNPDDAAYHIVTAVELTGPIHPSALADAAAAIVARHDALRTTFASHGAYPTARVSAAEPGRPSFVDLTDLPEQAQDSALRRCLRDLASHRFDLRTGPLAAWTLLRLGPHRHVLVLRVHHIVFDGGSLAVACHELQAGYAAAQAGRPAALPPAGTPAEPAYQSTDLAYWTRVLAGAPDRLRVLPEADAGASTVTFTLGQSRAEQVRQVARQHRSTPFLLLLSVFAALVSRYTGRDDLVIGSPISLHDPARDRPSIGLALNMLPLRLDVRGDAALAEVLRRARDVVLDAFEHRTVPFERIVNELRPPRDLSYTPIFQVVFAYQQSPEPPRFPGVRTRLLPVEPDAAKYDLTVIATEQGGDLELTVQAGVGDPAAVQVFAANLDTMLAGALADPAGTLGRIPLLGPLPHTTTPAADTRHDPARPHMAPRTDLERAVAAVWCAILDVDTVDVDANFFDQGGNSVRLLALHHALGEALAVDLALIDLFRFPTVAALAAHLTDRSGGDDPVAAASARGARRRAARAAGSP
jgi:hypothetical protein